MDADTLNLPGTGLTIVDIATTPNLLLVRIAATAASASCPRCGRVSDRVHSRYTRTIADLPAHDRPVALRLVVRLFRCPTPGCPRAIFCERLPALATPHARATDRLTDIHRLVGLALGGEPGSRLSDHLDIPTSPDTLLRRVKDVEDDPAPPPRFVGIDDWAWSKGRRYGTIVVDLERGRVIDLLPGRDAQAVERWLAAHPGVELITRDRWSEYARAATAAAPGARQVADRWHLLKNLREAIERLFERQSGLIAQALKGAESASEAVAEPIATDGDEGRTGIAVPDAPRTRRPGPQLGSRPIRRSGGGASRDSSASMSFAAKADRSAASPRSWACLATPCADTSGAPRAPTGKPAGLAPASWTPSGRGSTAASRRDARTRRSCVGSWPPGGARRPITR